MASIMVSRLQLAMFLYLVIIALIMAYRPALMFTPTKEAKAWAIENTNTTSILAPAFSFPLIAVLCYYIAVVVEMS